MARGGVAQSGMTPGGWSPRRVVTTYTPTLWVNSSTGDDSRSKATVAASGGSLPWATIGRAAWGSTNRAAPSTAEAADVGDVVNIAAGRYNTSVAVNNGQFPVYNPANQGSGGTYITFQAIGAVYLGANAANAPVIGANGRNYIRWYADQASGSKFLMTCDGRVAVNDVNNDDTKADANVVNTRPDTGPVVLWDCDDCWIEGCDIDGGFVPNYTDNWDGIRCEEALRCTIRNNRIYGFHNLTDTANGTGIKLYGCTDSIVEHNDIQDCGSGIGLKDSAGVVFNTNSGIRIRFNYINGCNNAAFWSMTSEGRNFFYQNLCIGGDIGVYMTGGGFTDDWIFNNTFVGIRSGGFGTAFFMSSSSGSGGRFWGNIFYDCDYVITLNGFAMPADTVIDFEHNLAFTYTNYYTGSDGNRSFASYKTAYANQDQASPASVDSDPLFVNAAAGNYRLQGGSPAENLSVDIDDLDQDASTVDTITAGCYRTGTEEIGLET